MDDLTPQELRDKLKECCDINRALRGCIIVMRSREARIEATEAGSLCDTVDFAYKRGMDDGAWYMKELKLQNEALKKALAAMGGTELVTRYTRGQDRGLP